MLITIAISLNETCIYYLNEFPEKILNLPFIVASPTMPSFKEHTAIQIYLKFGVSVLKLMYIMYRDL